MENRELTETVEDYLGAIYIFERDGQPVVGARLADLFGVKPSTVTNTLKRLLRDGWLVPDAQKHYLLTEAGMTAARSLMRRHMLVERMLSNMLSWSNVHQEAHHIEHTISSDVEKALQESLGHPKICPHGNPLPGYEDLVAAWTPLTQMKRGDSVIIRRIHELIEENHETLAYLEDKGIMPDHRFQVDEVLPFNQTITLCQIEGCTALSLKIAGGIYVEIDGLEKSSSAEDTQVKPDKS